MTRCGWAGSEGTEMCRYHDLEWGRAVYDDRVLFEFLILESFQAGLSWSTILRKREAFRRAFSNFNAQTVAAYGETDFQRLMSDEGIVRCRRKIEAAAGNARAFLAIRAEFGSFSDWLWSFTDGKQIVNRDDAFPVSSPLSDRVSSALKARGMKYVGTVIVYSYLCAVGVICDHSIKCFCHPENAEQIG